MGLSDSQSPGSPSTEGKGSKATCVRKSAHVHSPKSCSIHGDHDPNSVARGKRNPSRPQFQGENAIAIAPESTSATIKPGESNIHADRTTKIGPDELTARNQTAQTIIRDAYNVEDDQAEK